MNALQQLAEFAVECRDKGVPDEVSRSMRQRVLDILGISLGAHRLPSSQAVVTLIAGEGGRPDAGIIGRTGHRVPAAQAAFANGVLAHSLDYDDTHLPSVLHPSASVVPAALAAGEAAGSSGEDLIRAAAAGVEVVVRLGMAGYDSATNTSLFFERGQHATSICGTVGAAAAAALLFNLDAEQVGHAMAISVSFAGGVLEGNRTGGTVKRMHCGSAAAAGVRAAQLAAAGITGPPTVLEGRFGFYQVFLSGQYDERELTGELGERWAVPGIFFKPYPANHFTHAGIDAARAMAAAGLRPQDVAEAELAVAAAPLRTIGEPTADKRAPLTGYQAQFSGPYTVAAALYGGGGLGLGIGDFTDELARDPDRRALMARISVVSDPVCDEIFPNQFPAILRVRTHDGRRLEERVLANRGGPQRPLDDTELHVKLVDAARHELSGPGCDRLAEQVFDLPRAPDLSGLVAAAGAGPDSDS